MRHSVHTCTDHAAPKFWQHLISDTEGDYLQLQQEDVAVDREEEEGNFTCMLSTVSYLMKNKDIFYSKYRLEAGQEVISVFPKPDPNSNFNRDFREYLFLIRRIIPHVLFPEF